MVNNREHHNQDLTTDKRTAFLSAVPPLLFGSGITVSALVIWKPWYQVATWRLYSGVAVFVLFTSIIFAGGVWAVRSRLPLWGYSWAGAGLMSTVMAVKTIAEERADAGLAIINPFMDTLIAVLLLLAIFILLYFAGRRGWQAAGLVSIGFVAILTLSIITATTAAPFNRYDLALLSMPVCILIAAISYLYVLVDDRTRVALLTALLILSGSAVWLVDRVWMESLKRSSSFWPFFVVVALALFSGPVTAFLLEWLSKLFRIKKNFHSNDN